MIFSTKSNKHHVKSFVLNVSSGSQDNPVAFGPGSVVNGNVVIQVSKPQTVKKLKVVFQCTEHSGKLSNIIFSVESILHGGQRTQGQELSVGNHMYLFAIKLPDVNYPPTLRDSYINHKVNYTLQGFLDVLDPDQELQTHSVHIMYLPLIICQPSISSIQRKKIYQNGEHFVQVIAELVRPAYCPGDLCTIKMITQNRSDFRIAHVDLAVMSTTTSHMSTSTSINPSDCLCRHNHTLYTDKFYTAINKRTTEQHTLLQFRIPTLCAPSIQTHRHIDISYQIMMTVPLYYTPSSSFSSSSTSTPTSSSSSTVSSLMISLPITIATVPYTCPLPPQLQIPLPSYQDSQDNQLASDMPTFLNQQIGDESPLPSPRSVFSVEDTGSWSDPDRCSISPMMMEEQPITDLRMIPSLALDSTTTINSNIVKSQQDESGHLMVPRSSGGGGNIISGNGSGGNNTNGINSNDRRRRSLNMSSSSTSSDIPINECSIEINEFNPSASVSTVT